MIEFQYFQECPNASSTLNNLKALLEEDFFPESELKLIQVPTPELAAKLNFQGSPTILVDGIDIYSESRPNVSSFNCRIYVFNGESTGIIPKEFIKAQIQRMRNPQK